MSTPEDIDPYFKLRPEGPTREYEICHCAAITPLVLVTRLSSNPLACLICNSEVPPERVGFSVQLAEDIAFWRNLYNALYHLWLDSGEYEAWARARLEEPQGQVNRLGLRIVAQLNEYRPTYYSWFEDGSQADLIPLAYCPVCHRHLVERFGNLACELCSVLFGR